MTIITITITIIYIIEIITSNFVSCIVYKNIYIILYLAY